MNGALLSQAGFAPRRIVRRIVKRACDKSLTGFLQFLALGVGNVDALCVRVIPNVVKYTTRTLIHYFLDFTGMQTVPLFKSARRAKTLANGIARQ